jgi:hypothetical protein
LNLFILFTKARTSIRAFAFVAIFMITLAFQLTRMRQLAAVLVLIGRRPNWRYTSPTEKVSAEGGRH